MSEKYKVLHGGGPDAVKAGEALSIRVNDAIADGWKPVGGVTAVPGVGGPALPNYVEFAQAIMK